MYSSWNNQMNSKALHASLFCFGLSGRKEDGKMVRWRPLNWSIKKNNSARFFVPFVAVTARPRRENV